MARKKKKSKVIIINPPPSLIKRITIVIVGGFFALIPLGVYLRELGSLEDLDYRSVLAQSFIFNTNYFSLLPEIRDSNPVYNLLLTTFVLQLSILSLLLGMLIPLEILRLLLHKVARGNRQFFSAYISSLIQRIVYLIYYLRATAFHRARPFLFYTEESIENRSVKSIIYKSIWITIVIFAVSFQFAGLFFFKSGAFPRIFHIKTSVIDASVTFMALTGTLWFSFLLGIDLLERFDIKILDLSSAKLTNIGRIFGNITRKSLSFLTISFLFVALQDFNSQDWIQTVVFIDLFYLIGIWVLMSHEANLEHLGNQIRKSIHRRTLAGAERKVIELEKKRLGESKIREAEKLMQQTEARVITAQQHGFTRILIEFFILIELIPVLLLATIYILGSFDVAISLSLILYYESILVAVIFFSFFVFHFYLMKYRIMRTELPWFPIFYVGHLIILYYHFDKVFPFSQFEMLTTIIFELLWFFLVFYNILSRSPGNEFWSFNKKIVFFIFIFIYWLISVFFQIWLFTTY